MNPLSQQGMSLSVVFDRVDIELGIVTEISEPSILSPLSQQTMFLALDGVDAVLDTCTPLSEPFVFSTLLKSDITLSVLVICSADAVLGDSFEPPTFSSLSQLYISASTQPDGFGDVGLGDDRESGERPKEAELVECRNVSLDWLPLTFNAFLCSIFPEIILNHFGVKWQNMTP